MNIITNKESHIKHTLSLLHAAALCLGINAGSIDALQTNAILALVDEDSRFLCKQELSEPKRIPQSPAITFE